jgi:hypothetical protein
LTWFEAVVTGVLGADVSKEFNVVVHGQGISVWVNAGLDAEVFDAQGGLVPCAHQRPDGAFKSAAR